MDKITCLEAPVEKIDGRLMLKIPLRKGGQALVECTRGLAQTDAVYLRVTIAEWLAEKLGIEEGSLVIVDNAEGRFNIRLSPLP